MTDISEMYDVTDPQRRLTDDERRLFRDRLPSSLLDAPAAYVTPLKKGGSLRLIITGDLVTVLVINTGEYVFGYQLPRAHLISFIEGGTQPLPGVGILVATPIKNDLVRLCLVPERGKGKPWEGYSFSVDVSVKEVMACL